MSEMVNTMWDCKTAVRGGADGAHVKGERVMTKEEAIKMIENDKRIHHDFLSGKYRQALTMAINALRIDIVHCRECKYADSIKCPMYYKGLGYTDDDFCSYGERREND